MNIICSFQTSSWVDPLLHKTGFKKTPYYWVATLECTVTFVAARPARHATPGVVGFRPLKWQEPPTVPDLYGAQILGACKDP